MVYAFRSISAGLDSAQRPFSEYFKQNLYWFSIITYMIMVLLKFRREKNNTIIRQIR